LAHRLHLKNDDVVEVSAGGRSVSGPVWIQPGQAENTITLHLGYGRERIGRISRNAGFNVSPLRTSDSFWRASGVEIKKTGATHHLVATQIHHNVDKPDRQVYRAGTLSQFIQNAEFLKASLEVPKPEETLYDNNEFQYNGYKWAMSIDLNACIGCNACLLACNVENNVPVVGKDQVDRHREMYWIRIDTYFQGSPDAPTFHHMPVPCMHCEHAPCELVCPVAATVHDHEGLNVQVYNRCVGTRFCSNNCPYKVRRFNFLQYSDYRTPNLRPMYNPEVTVRWRGVMEKCTYCIQRISHARIKTEKENRRIRDDEIQTACQQACPARAIVFGDLNTPESKVAALKQHPLDYSMLGELNTRPRTTYLAKLRNANPDLETSRPS
jgi:molybdopterin-containing oxidoreductase family iron-sulfur binding subunit